MVPVDGPLVDDADDEVAENGLKEDHRGNKVGIDVREALETNVVGNLQTKSERHLDRASARSASESDKHQYSTYMNNSENDGHLHLVRVRE